MCGIIGYVGHRKAAGVLVSGLKRLEYRGYDSAGVALCMPGSERVRIVKTQGKISELETKVGQELPGTLEVNATTGVGHTRWATHGVPNEVNAHPHISKSGTFAIAHNGIIENYRAIKERLIQKGYTFVSQTDSEVIAHLIEECYHGDFREAVANACDMLAGTYGIAVVSTHHPDTIVAVSKGSPVVVGVCDDETVIASDVSAILNFTRQVINLIDGDVVTATATSVDIASVKNVPVSRQATQIDWDIAQIEKGGYKHFMQKEMHEQPEVLANATRGRLLPDEGTAKLSGMQMSPAEIARVNRVMIAACGTSFHAGMIGKYFFEEFAGIPTEVEQAAELRYRNPIIQPDTCMLTISQSGETADTLAALREGLRKGASVLGLCNVVGSTIAREAGRGIYLHAGPEIGVASTKAFTCQVSVLAMLAILFGRTRRLSLEQGRAMIAEVGRVPQLAEAVLAQDDAIRKIAERYVNVNNAFFIGRGYMFPTALEGALKLKEISYIHAEGYHASELKHGPIALLERKVPVVALAPNGPQKSKMLSNIQECCARNSPVLGITTEGDTEVKDLCQDTIFVPPCADFIAPIPVVIVTQLFAYHVAVLRGCNVDQPRNLAKSVTVE
jgi:glucosamine--fructose-6-phosphate aminotransferase (isomerizing)